MLKPGLLTLLHVAAAGAIYWWLVTGGWLTQHYRFGDPNIVNLLLAFIEPIVLVVVLAYWLTRRVALYRAMAWLALLQLIIGSSFLVFFLFFALMFHAKLM